MLPGLRSRPWRAAGLLPLLAAEYLAGARILRYADFALIHAHWAVPHGFIGARLKGGRALLCTSHGSDLFALNGAWVRPFKQHALAQADAVTVVSGALRIKAESLVPGIAAQVMPMGIDTQRFTPPAADVPRDGLLYVGRLVQDKGVQTLLQALAGLQARGLRPRLTLVGSGPAEAMLKSLTRDLDLASQVEFRGALPNAELPDLYRRAQALVFPSLLGPRGEQEGMGLVPVEALACECAVIASRLAAVGEVVRDEETGLLFTPGDPAALAACIERMLMEPELARLTAAVGRQQVTATYDWQDVAQRYRGLYESLVSSRRA
jgi:glycosyltransferase involved in cell wall biosynthesis